MKKKITGIMLALILVLTLLFVCPFFVSADFGNAEFGDGGNYGGDYGGGDWGGDYSGGSGVFLSGLGSFGGFGGGVFAVVVIIIIVLIVFKNKNGAPPRRASSAPYTGRNYAEIEKSVVASVLQTDPGFSADEFKSFSKDVYLRAQESWEAKNLPLLRPYISERYYNNIETQLKEFIVQKKTNHLDAQCITEAYIAGFSKNEKTETLTVRLRASMLDYTTPDDSADIILSGSKTTRADRIYRLEFIRTSGMQTTHEKGLFFNECPSCGAPLEVTSAGVCEYCKNIITSGEYGWVLNNYTLWRD